MLIRKVSGCYEKSPARSKGIAVSMSLEMETRFPLLRAGLLKLATHIRSSHDARLDRDSSRADLRHTSG
jgi:hypothetical protein